MLTKFTPEYQTRLIEAWNKFINYEDYDYSFIRPEIFASWQRSRDAKASLANIGTSFLNSNELNIRINSNLGLIEVVRPYMEKIYSIVQGSDFYLLFCDKDGYILDLIGDPSIIEYGKNKSMLVVGANRSESVAGTNAIGTCIHQKEPIQIWGGEHYLTPHKAYTCSCAPIMDSNGNLLGCINLTGRSENVHPHTLGLVICAADGIEKEISIRRAYADIELISAQRNSIIQTMTSGIFLLNTSGRIIQMNNVALEMLNLDYENIIGKEIFDFISFNEKHNTESDFAMLKKERYNTEINVYDTSSVSPPKRLNMSINFVRDSSGNINGTVMRFNEPKLINKLVNNISGYRPKYTFDSIIGKSPAVKQLIDDCKCAAQSSSNVLILGQSGTGKELLAHAIHNASEVSSGPFVALNCAALPKGLVESELFGYEKGAFTGANRDGNPGKFELADGGTIFLDEIGDMPLDVQASLLRVIQTKEIVRIGGKYPKSINVRIIAATNKNLSSAIEEKTFREDLYYRLNVLNIPVPSLAERGNDVCLLADYFISQYSTSRNMRIAEETYPYLLEYSWPGNIRQLENVIERAVNITDSDIILPEHLPVEIRENDPQQKPAEKAVPAPPVRVSTEDELLSALEQTAGNVTEAAKLLGLSRRTMYRKLDKYSIDYTKFRH